MSFLGDIFGGGETTVNVPGRSPEENALLAEQTSILRSQNEQLSKALKQQDLLQPLLFGELGIAEVRDASGNVTGYTKSLSPEAQKRADLESRFLDLSLAQLEGVDPAQSAEINRLLGERSLAALRGELPADPALLRSLDEEETRLRDNLRAQLGPGFETSTPGIQAMAEFTKRKQEIISGAQRADLTLAEGLNLSRDASTFGQASGGTNIAEALRSRRFGEIMGAGSTSLPFINTGVNLASGFNGPLSNLASDRAMQFQANMGQAQLNAQSDNALWGGVGQFAGAALFAPTGGTTFGRIFGKV